jgi:protein involved in polysaccharide export with SLBB domain
MKLFLLLTMMISAFAHAAVNTGDVLAISIKGVPTEEQGLVGGEYQITSDGKIHLPYIPSIQATGVSTSALARKIESAYKSARIYTSPTISIQSLRDAKVSGKEIDEALQKFLTVSGQVSRPGPLAYRPGLKLIDAVSQASPTPFAAQNRVEVLRDGKIMKFNMKTPAHMLFTLQPDDQITLKEKGWNGQ